MTEEQEIALQRIKDPAYINCEGSEEDVALLQCLLEKVANSESGSKTLANLKRQEDLPKGHRFTIKIQDKALIGLPPDAGAVHQDDGSIILFKDGGNPHSEEELESWANLLEHELYHEQQDQEGIGTFANFTPEQNFIVNKLLETDAWMHDKGKVEYIKEFFEGLNGGSYYASIYNQQALMAAIETMHHGKTSDKSFDAIRDALVKRLGVDIDPEYFSPQTLANCYCGKFYFPDGKLPLERNDQDMTNGSLSIFKHPKCTVKIYTSADGNMEINEKLLSNTGEKSLLFVDKKSNATVLSIEQKNDDIQKVQTEKNPSECKDIEDFRQVVSKMDLSKDVCDVFGFDQKKVESFITDPPKKNNFNLKKFLAELSEKQEPTESKKVEIAPQFLDRVSKSRGR